MKKQRSAVKKQRSAVLLICVMVCLLVASSIVMASVRLSLNARRDQRWQFQMQQTELLLDAGIARAANNARSSVQYTRETWRPDKAIVQFDHPVVEIRVTSNDTGRLVNVTASLGGASDGSAHAIASRTRRSHSFQLPPIENNDTE